MLPNETRARVPREMMRPEPGHGRARDHRRNAGARSTAHRPIRLIQIVAIAQVGP
jgi:hypothetical protein